MAPGLHTSEDNAVEHGNTFRADETITVAGKLPGGIDWRVEADPDGTLFICVDEDERMTFSTSIDELQNLSETLDSSSNSIDYSTSLDDALLGQFLQNSLTTDEVKGLWVDFLSYKTQLESLRTLSRKIYTSTLKSSPQ